MRIIVSGGGTGGHKVLALPHHEGKLDAEEVDRYVTAFGVLYCFGNLLLLFAAGQGVHAAYYGSNDSAYFVVGNR